jgi:transcriptional regulator with GAF, ATPase, and Fis domain
MRFRLGMDLLSKFRETEGRVPGVLAVLLAGDSDTATSLRESVEALCTDIGATGGLLLGPPGSGKSTIARAVALGRYLHRVKEDRAAQIVRTISFDGPARLSKRHLDWYEELSLTGLVEGLADSQLFGIRKGVATGVDERPGVFQRAMRGHVSPGSDPTQGALATGGVVLLDEIGDLPSALQPKLLLVLTGAEVFMVGGEGDPTSGYAYRGLTIGATWKDPVQAGLRPDLLSRLADHVIRIPSLVDRREDVELLARVTLDEIKRSREARFRELLEQAAAVVDGAKLRRDAEVRFEFSADDLRVLRETDWRMYGELRGLTQVIKRAVHSGLSIESALGHQLGLGRSGSRAEDLAAALLDVALEIPYEAGTPVGHVRDAEYVARERLARSLREDRTSLQRLADHLGEDPAEVRKRLYDLTRRRTD